MSDDLKKNFAKLYDKCDEKMFFLEHLQELRWRIIKIAVAVLLFTLISYCYAPVLLGYIIKPVGKMYYMNPAEAFFAYLKISLVAGILLSIPVIAYQIWMFLLPAFHEREYRLAFLVIPGVVVLFWSGVVFAYFLVLPTGIKFFMGFADNTLQPLFSIGQYVSFVISFLLPFGCIFEFPLVVFVLAKLNLLTSNFLRKKRKIAILLSFIIGAILAPSPDIFSQSLVAVPLIFFYELSIRLITVVLKR